ncbi:hypothetical protein GCM10020255_065660 [Rhodococcus baikonurensis]
MLHSWQIRSPQFVSLLGSGSDQRSGSTAKVSGALIGALVVGGLVLGYGAKELVPTDDTAVSPVGTGSTTTTVSPEATTSTGSTIIPRMILCLR